MLESLSLARILQRCGGGRAHWCLCKWQTNNTPDRAGWHVSALVIEKQERRCAQTKGRVESRHTGRAWPTREGFVRQMPLSLFCASLPSTPDNSHCRWHSTLTSVQLYWCGPGGIPSVNREFSKGTPCCKGMSCIMQRFNHYLKVWHLIESDLIFTPLSNPASVSTLNCIWHTWAAAMPPSSPMALFSWCITVRKNEGCWAWVPPSKKAT